MRIKLFGKYYGWCPVLLVDLHMDSGTVQRHPFMVFKRVRDGFRWNSWGSLGFRDISNLTSWFVVGSERRFMWGVNASLWKLED